MEKEPIQIDVYSPRRPKNEVKIREGDKNFESVIRNMASAGLNDKEISQFVGVKLAQLKRRLKQIPNLEEALMQGRSEATQKMVAQMYMVAMGGLVTQKIKERINGRGEKTIEIMTEEAPPNPQMMMFWLTNVAADKWKYSRQLVKEDAQGLNVDGKILESDKITRLSREIFEGDTAGATGKHLVSEATAQPTGEGTQYEGDLRTDVQRAADDNIQDNVLDVSAEAGTVAVQTPAV
ncbi:MAG: hypothetical protein ACXADL_11965 [Candidatus Thorarchaeota archaeon]|jgi:hypothetical protein